MTSKQNGSQIQCCTEAATDTSLQSTQHLQVAESPDTDIPYAEVQPHVFSAFSHNRLDKEQWGEMIEEETE